MCFGVKRRRSKTATLLCRVMKERSGCPVFSVALRLLLAQLKKEFPKGNLARCWSRRTISVSKCELFNSFILIERPPRSSGPVRVAGGRSDSSRTGHPSMHVQFSILLGICFPAVSVSVSPKFVFSCMSKKADWLKKSCVRTEVQVAAKFSCCSQIVGASWLHRGALMRGS